MTGLCLHNFVLLPSKYWGLDYFKQVLITESGKETNRLFRMKHTIFPSGHIDFISVFVTKILALFSIFANDLLTTLQMEILKENFGGFPDYF
jgi:hypothetical protein